MSLKKHRLHFLRVLWFSWVLVALLSCDKKSSVLEIEASPHYPPFELDSVPEPPIRSSTVVVLSHSRYLFYDVAKEIALYYNAALLHINENTPDELTAKLKSVQPKYAIVVLPPAIIRHDLVASVFESFCSLEDDADLDIGYGYITGYTVEDARDLFYRSKRDTTAIGKFLGVSHFFEGDSWCRTAIHAYADQFRSAGWLADTAVIEEYPAANKEGEVRKLQNHQLIFFIGHGGVGESCGISSSDLNSIDLSGNVIIAGSCYTGATCSDDLAADPVALKIIQRGAAFYVSNVIGNGWSNVWFISEDICTNSMNFGDAVKEGINREMEWWREHYSSIADSSISRVISFGDPSDRPRLKCAVPIELQ